MTTKRLDDLLMSLEGENELRDEDLLKSLVKTVISELLEDEVQAHLQAQHYERCEERRGYRNGKKERTLKTRVGKLDLLIPQVRDCAPFRTIIFDRYQRTETALINTFQRMYLEGVSTRSVKTVLQELGGFEVSAQSVSRATRALDEEITAWRKRPLGEAYPFLFVDACYEKVRSERGVTSQAFMIVVGVNELGRRVPIGLYTGETESEETWGTVFRDLKARGVHGVKMLISDAHKGIISSARKEFLGVAWQRCRVHFLRELGRKLPCRERRELYDDVKPIYATLSYELGLDAAQEIAEKWKKRRPAVAKMLREGTEQTLTFTTFKYKEHDMRRLGSTNLIERVIKELRKRTKVIPSFPNEGAVVRIYGALLMDLEDRWEKRGIYIHV